MAIKKYVVTQNHASEYPEPITFLKGALLSVGRKYDGPEDWNDWFFCETPGQKGGWVPAQIIENTENGTAHAREDYTARELDINEGDVVFGARILNGWLWCEKPTDSTSGWVPLANIKEVEYNSLG